MLPRLKPIPIKDRYSVAYIEYGLIDAPDTALVVVERLSRR